VAAHSGAIHPYVVAFKPSDLDSVGAVLTQAFDTKGNAVYQLDPLEIKDFDRPAFHGVGSTILNARSGMRVWERVEFTIPNVKLISPESVSFESTMQRGDNVIPSASLINQTAKSENVRFLESDTNNDIEFADVSVVYGKPANFVAKAPSFSAASFDPVTRDVTAEKVFSASNVFSQSLGPVQFSHKAVASNKSISDLFALDQQLGFVKFNVPIAKLTINPDKLGASFEWLLSFEDLDAIFVNTIKTQPIESAATALLLISDDKQFNEYLERLMFVVSVVSSFVSGGFVGALSTLMRPFALPLFSEFAGALITPFANLSLAWISKERALENEILSDTVSFYNDSFSKRMLSHRQVYENLLNRVTAISCIIAISSFQDKRFLVITQLKADNFVLLERLCGWYYEMIEYESKAARLDFYSSSTYQSVFQKGVQRSMMNAIRRSIDGLIRRLTKC
jgi:hypothetical protein